MGRVGSKTTPTVPMFAFSGWRAGLPPTVELSWVLLSPLLTPLPADEACAAANAAHRAPVAVPGAALAHGSTATSALGACPPYRSETSGARKPVEYVPRRVKSRIGRHRPPNLYV